MALTSEQIFQAHKLTGYGYDTNSLFYKRLTGVSADQETEIGRILTQYGSIEFDKDKIKAEGLQSNPDHLRAELRRQLLIILNLPTGRSFRIGRG